MTETILVTGASRGIGKAITIALANAGYDLTAHYVRDSAGADDTVSTVAAAGASARKLQFDIANREQTRTTLEADIDQHGAYYGVVCNAGISSDAAFPMLSGDDWDNVVHTNLDGFYNVLSPIVMPMIRRRKPGRIVTLSSVSGLVGNRGQVNYSAAKAGIIGASKALALELASRQITVNCIAPGLIDTDMTEQAPVDEIKKLIPAGRIGQPEEVAGLVRFLMSEEAAYITRQVIAVNGGLV
ncbi:MAG: 3-oxoacyl-ACP reductase FabG [Gammaproteobacteria bacterium]|nr:3-oxoacyl-ACP reductase FabG [Gammaproteobacteria bacterium]